MNLSSLTKSLSSVRYYALLLSIIWTLMLGASLIWNIHLENNEVINMAKAEARGVYNKDLVYRRWAAGHGGVYVPVTDKTPPNPNLSHIPERDIQTPSGKQLTLVNPAYMTRQVHELGYEQYGLQGHITSLNPIRAENAPDLWEIEALRGFEVGLKETTSVEQIDGKSYLRYMSALITEPSCLKCHSTQGYKVGDIRGGISISIPLEPYKAIAQAHLTPLILGHLVIWIFGMGGLGVGSVTLNRRVREKERARNALIESETSLVEAQRIAHIGCWELDLNRNELKWSDEVYRMFGLEPQQFDATYEAFLENIHPDDREMVNEAYSESVKSKIPYNIVHRLLLNDGIVKYVNEKCETFYDDDGNPIRSTGTIQDITEQKMIEEQLLRGKHDLGERMKELGCLYNLSKLIERQDVTMEEIFQGTVDIIPPSWQYPEVTCSRVSFDGSEYVSDSFKASQWLQSSDIIVTGKKLGSLEVFYTKECPESDEGPFLKEERSLIDSIARTLNETIARKKLHHQFLQSQKMEGIGQLAGGVAHDFNNLLTVISGHADLALQTCSENKNVQNNLEEILASADRATDLTRQLLAFSRKQTLQPKVLNINTTVKSLHSMLKRIIGEDINLETKPGRGLWNVNADPGQLEQVILNLAVNARDAMPRGGKLIIETDNIELNAEYADDHHDVKAGPHVMLAVTDTGSGMTDEVRSRIFEPFFTTKEADKGTGLGLATVYGIVKQSGGNIWVYSEVGKGTTFKIYLPMVKGEAEKLIILPDSADVPGGTETVLIVEDEDSVRELACKILEQRGYKVVEAASGIDALKICNGFRKPVDLVITDVIMPGMSGAELVKSLRERWPELKVLYMSGYTDNAIVHHGVLDADIPYLQKPFRAVDILNKTREVIDSK